jgi:hypothetical protein
MPHRSVTVTLIKNTTAGHSLKTFTGQTCDIKHEPTHWERSVDSPPSPGLQPTTIIWYEGKAEWFGRDAVTGLYDVTQVKIVASDGSVLIDEWELITNPGIPRDIDKGVEFSVLRPHP